MSSAQNKHDPRPVCRSSVHEICPSACRAQTPGHFSANAKSTTFRAIGRALVGPDGLPSSAPKPQHQSEASARNEMLATSVQGKIFEMQDKSMDYEAENELQKLEEKLGMRPASTPAVTEAAPETVTVSTGPSNGQTTAPVDAAKEAQLQSQAEKELEELEKRLQGGG